MRLKAEDYENFNEIIFCSNYLKKYGSIIKQNDNGFEPLIIKKGEDENILVFLQGYDSSKLEPIDIVNGNKSIIDSVIFESSKTGCFVSHNGIIILEIVQNEDDIMEVINLDLRPVGFNIFGDSTALNMGGNTMSRSSMSNIGSR
jgi:hypothetical protein